MTLARIILLTLLLGPLLAACGDRTGHVLVITGSSTVAPVMADLAAAFEVQHPDWRIDVQSGGSSRGIRDVREGLADAGMISRALLSGEQDLEAHLLAHDGIAVILHAGNPVTRLTEAEIAAIYRGRIDNWDRLGGGDRPVMVIDKAAGRGTREVFLKHFDIAGPAVEADLVAGENQQVIRTVATNPAAIGYVSIGAAEVEAASGQPLRLLALGGVAATTASVGRGDYPLSRPLNVVTRGEPSADLQRFMSFWQSPEAVAIIKDHYFVPTGP